MTSAKYRMLAAVALVLLWMVAPVAAQEATPGITSYPVTIQNCGQSLTFSKAPERVVPLQPITAEFLLRLGLGDRIVGTGFTDSDPVAPDLKSAYAALPVLSTDAPPAREVLLSAKPDLVLDNFPFFDLSADSGFASVDQLAEQGAATYVLTARCSGNEATGKMADIYTDITNFGIIFDVQTRAATLISALQSRVDAVQDRTAGLPPVKVLIYDGGESPMTIYGPGAMSSVVEAAGGENIFGNLPTELNMLSAEEVAVANPDVIIILDHQGTPAMSMTAAQTFEEKVAVLTKDFPNSNAAKNNRFVSLPFQQVYASLQDVDGVEALARAFYPEAFTDLATPQASDPE